MTQAETLLAHLRRGLSISTFEAYSLYQITCAGQRMTDLRRNGWLIQSKTEHSNGKHYSRYWLNHCTGCTDGQLFGAHQSGTIEHGPGAQITKEDVDHFVESEKNHKQEAHHPIYPPWFIKDVLWSK